QNGLDNAGTLARLLPGRKVLAGMVPFNVVMLAAGVYHQGSSGQLVVQQDPAVDGFAEAFRHAGLPLKQAADMQGVLWAKLLLNLNNAVNALANLPLREELAQRDFRRCLALAMQEALALLELDGRVRLARLAPLPMRWLPSVLRLPDWIFARLARQMLEIDEKARSSMSDDLEAGRLPEIRWLNGEIVALALSLRRPAPV
ncbi:MAG: 2-dehydropantoate 2-reductase, partial [Alcanivoracaceae bacterium]|nr:2-dehydropantoate 2-reductase [Alcanivoracaceae bacterium]